MANIKIQSLPNPIEVTPEDALTGPTGVISEKRVPIPPVSTEGTFDFKRGVEGVKEAYTDLFGRMSRVGQQSIKSSFEHAGKAREKIESGEPIEAFGQTFVAGQRFLFSPFEALVGGITEPAVEDAIKALPEESQQKVVDTVQGISDWYEGLSDNEKTAVDVGISALEIITTEAGGQLLSKLALRGGKTIKSAAERGFDVITKTAKGVKQEGVEFISNLRKAVASQPNKTAESVTEDILKAVDQDIIDAVQADAVAKEFGVELPPESFAKPVKSKIAQVIRGGWFGSDAEKRYKSAVDSFAKKVDELQQQAQTSGELGEDIVKRFGEVEADKRKIINDLYDDVAKLTEEAGTTIDITTTRAQGVMQQLVDRKTKALKTGIGTKKEVAKVEKILQGLKTNKDLPTLRSTLEEIADLANFDTFDPTTEQKLYQKLYGALKEDIDKAIIEQAPELADTLKTANKEFADWETLKQRPFAKQIQKLGKTGDVDTLADKLTKTNVSTNEITQLYDTLGPGTKEKIQKKIISDILEKAKSPREGFTAAGFSKQLNKIGDERLKVLLEPEQIQLLKNLDKVNKLIAKAGSVEAGSQTFPLQQAARILAAPMTGGGSVLAEFGLASILKTPKGQAWIKGFDDKLAEQIIKALKESGEDMAF